MFRRAYNIVGQFSWFVFVFASSLILGTVSYVYIEHKDTPIILFGLAAILFPVILSNIWSLHIIITFGVPVLTIFVLISAVSYYNNGIVTCVLLVFIPFFIIGYSVNTGGTEGVIDTINAGLLYGVLGGIGIGVIGYLAGQLARVIKKIQRM